MSLDDLAAASAAARKEFLQLEEERTKSETLWKTAQVAYGITSFDDRAKASTPVVDMNQLAHAHGTACKAAHEARAKYQEAHIAYRAAEKAVGV